MMESSAAVFISRHFSRAGEGTEKGRERGGGENHLQPIFQKTKWKRMMNKKGEK